MEQVIDEMKITEDGFVWKIINLREIKDYLCAVYVLHDDGTESLVTSDSECTPDNVYGVEVGTLPDHMTKALNDDKKCVIRWGVDDVRGCTDKALTYEQAYKVLHDMESTHDATIGINWDVIECHIEEIKK